MAAWLILVVGAAVLGFLLRPLVSGQVAQSARERGERGRLSDLVTAKEATYAALKEIEFDRLTRKLDEGDYRMLRTRYRAQAVRLLEEIEVLEAERRPSLKRRQAQRRGPAGA